MPPENQEIKTAMSNKEASVSFYIIIGFQILSVFVSGYLTSLDLGILHAFVALGFSFIFIVLGVTGIIQAIRLLRKKFWGYSILLLLISVSFLALIPPIELALIIADTFFGRSF